MTPFGANAGFGHGDWAEEVTWRILPEHVRNEDGLGSVVPDPLRGIIDSIKPLLNELLRTWRRFPSLWDANQVPLAQLPALAYNVGLSVDDTKSEQLQRSEVLNVAQLVLTKGTDQGYTILAGFEGLLVEITPLWAENKIPGATLTPDAPTLYVPSLDDHRADDLPLDSEFEDKYATWPITLQLPLNGPCRSYSLRLVFLPLDEPSVDFDPDVANRISQRLLRFVPAHVRIESIAFDGLRGASQVWDASVSADAISAGMWVAPIVAELRAASAPWVDSVDADAV